MPTNDTVSVPLISKNGIRGKVLNASSPLDGNSKTSVIFETGREAAVPTEHLHLKSDGTYYLDLTVDPRSPEPTSTAHSEYSSDKIDDLVLPVVQEHAVFSKRVVETGRVRVRKTVSQEAFTIDEPLVRDEYDIERVPINKVVTETVAPRVEGNTTIVSVYEEQSFVVKRLVLREEIHLVKKHRTVHHRDTITLRKENVDVERVPTIAKSV